MSGKTKGMFAVAVVAFLICAARFVPGTPLPPNLADFFGGFGVGILIGAVATWFAERRGR